MSPHLRQPVISTHQREKQKRSLSVASPSHRLQVERGLLEGVSVAEFVADCENSAAASTSAERNQAILHDSLECF
jgi:hypothetical protein